jgi:triphosphatase
MTTEIELKFALSQHAALKLTEFLADYSMLSEDSFLLTNTYYDTPEHKLRKHHCGLRLRSIETEEGQTSYEMTIKHGNKGVAGLHQRQEYNVTLPNKQLDLSLFPTEALPISFEPQLLATQIIPLFNTNFHRRIWLINYHQSQIELAFDKGYIEKTSYRLPIDELELELKQGEINPLLDFAYTLSSLGIRILSQSKAARGYQLVNQSPLSAGALPSINSTIDEAKVLHALLKYWQQNEEFALQQNDTPAFYHTLQTILPQFVIVFDSLNRGSLTDKINTHLVQLQQMMVENLPLSEWLYQPIVTQTKLLIMKFIVNLKGDDNH